jgi:hypothetical protein
MSWILEVRSRLTTPAPNRQEGVPESRFAILLPLYVEAGELWVVLGEGEGGAALFHGRPVAEGEDAWEKAREAGHDLGLEPASVLRLGELDELGTSQERLSTWVGAVPTVHSDELPKGVYSLPLRALLSPSMVEEREGPGGAALRVLHIGRRRLWGLPLWVLELLLARLGLSD